MLDDPVANLEMPPDIEIENRELEVECTSSHGREQSGENDELQRLALEESTQVST